MGGYITGDGRKLQTEEYIEYLEAGIEAALRDMPHMSYEHVHDELARLIGAPTYADRGVA